ncbi:hypothetical protein [Streptomyces sp. NBC_00094]|uniref:hypothetical protein n=1 Tax=Streptomyces sp. NBC_00094 TaxID=2903620 RepID=UPI00224F3999|nr:hypothetical protein [Streptomyces sp. NBC_00094]MCX5390256.1 hypothetical protein [Streptomyces sp. NBC_00094]
MIRGITRTAAALAAASLLLTACGGGDDTADAKPSSAAPTGHPVFDQKLDRQLFLAARQTQKAGNARFVQTLTFGSKKTGDLVRTMTGRMDFAGGRGQADVVWKVPKGVPEETRTVVLGQTPGRGDGPASVGYLVDGQQIHYRAASSDYWIRYASGETTVIWDDAIDHLRGTEGPIGGTLLEGLSAAEAATRSDTAAGRTYRASMPFAVLFTMFPHDLRRELRIGIGSPDQQDPVPLTATVDREGRITRAEADLTKLLRKDGAFAGFTSLTTALTLTGYGTSAPVMTPSGTVRAAAEDVLAMRDVKDGGCVDFDSGQRLAHMVVNVDCAGPHDARVFTRIALREGTSTADTQERSNVACAYAHDVQRPAWLPKATDIWAWWTPVPKGQPGKDGVTCYVPTKRGDS